MKGLATVLILALASTNASRYYQAEREFQQEPRKIPYLAIALNEDQFVPLVEEAASWESFFDPRMVLFNNLDSLENFLQVIRIPPYVEEDPNEFRIKRTKTSLSIDNPLDVLRQQYFKALARRLKYKSIEKNREHLLKTGKRSGKEILFPINLAKQSNFHSGRDFSENGSQETGDNIIEQKPTTRRYQNRLDDLSYQT